MKKMIFLLFSALIVAIAWVRCKNSRCKWRCRCYFCI